MFTRILAVSVGMLVAATVGSQASAPDAAAIETAATAGVVIVTGANEATPTMTIARRGADDPAGHDHGHRGKGGKGRGGNDDGPNHT